MPLKLIREPNSSHFDQIYSEYLQCPNPKSNQWLTWKLHQWVEARNKWAGRGHIKICWTVLALLQWWLLGMLTFWHYFNGEFLECSIFPWVLAGLEYISIKFRNGKKNYLINKLIDDRIFYNHFIKLIHCKINTVSSLINMHVRFLSFL